MKRKNIYLIKNRDFLSFKMLTKDYLEYVCDENTYFVKIVDINFSNFFNSVQGFI